MTEGKLIKSREMELKRHAKRGKFGELKFESQSKKAHIAVVIKSHGSIW